MSTNDETTSDFLSVQSRLADIPGEAGIRARQEEYRAFFLRFGRDVVIEEGCRFVHPDRIVLDDDVRINIGTLIYGSGGVHIGRHARIGPRCFIHSANHDIAHGPTAFHERGYDDAPVRIGDNCLISANVSILPGVKFSNGVFVACGAVIAAGTYLDDARLFGVPARERVQDTNTTQHVEAPSIAIVTSNKQRAAAARLLVTVLGLPQVRVFDDCDELPKSIHSVVVLDSESHSTGQTAQRVWKLCETKQRRRGDMRLPAAIRAQRGLDQYFPGYSTIRVVPALRPELSAGINAASQTLYYAYKRLRKRSEPLNIQQRIEVYCLLLALEMLDDSSTSDLQKILVRSLEGDRSTLRESETALRTALFDRDDIAEILVMLAEMINDCCPASCSGAKIQTGGGVHQIDAPALLRYPPSILAASCVHDPVSAALETEELEDLLNQCTKVDQLSYIGLAAIFNNNDAVLNDVKQRFFGDLGLYDHTSGCIRNINSHTSYCYSPVLAAFLILVEQRKDPTFSPSVEHTMNEKFEWSIFDVEDADWQVTVGDEHGTLIDRSTRRISVSLFDNWLAAMRVPELNGGQIELSAENYHPLASALEQCWLELFKYMQHEEGQALVRIRPWPSGCRAAVSLRYDVDRNTSVEQMQGIVDTQRTLLNAACASWYFIPAAAHSQRLLELLPRYGQERGIHGLKAGDAEKGRGITMHSGPGGEYWRGAETITSMDAARANYGEMLSSQLIYPRPVWNEQQATNTWMLPIHFPLEGSTSESTLEFFDRLQDQFREMIELGGHAIIASHPDLNQELLRELLEREDLQNVWFATIGDVVDRCRKLLEYGAISIVESPNENEIVLLSKNTLADVTIEVYPPNDKQMMQHCLQFNAQQPRSLVLS